MKLFSLRRFSSSLFLALVALGLPWRGAAEAENEPAPQAKYSRPKYNLNLILDYALLTFSADGTISIPVQTGDAISDAVFFIYANAPGVSGNDKSHKNVVVDDVSMNGQKLEYSLNGAVLRVKLPAPQTKNFALQIKWRGVVPRSPAGSGGIMDALGGMDIGALLGGAPQAKKEPDYGVYSYGNGVLSLGSFWYPSLAVRQNGKWIDEAPSGVGDVGFSEASDFDVAVNTSSPNVKLVTTGYVEPIAATIRETNFSESKVSRDQQIIHARNVRDFALLASDQFIVKSRLFYVGHELIGATVYVTKAHADKAEKALDIACHALEIYSKKFGICPYQIVKVVEGPMRGGAGGMEFSGLVSIASFLFDDMDKQMAQLAGGLGAGDGAAKVLGDLGLDEDGGAPKDGAAKKEDANANPATDLLSGMLGQQKAIFDSLLEETIAHEVAHQWWAMGVGSDAQRAPWQDESLTNYSSMIYFEERYGKEKMAQMMDLHLRQSYSMGRMLGSPDAKVNLATDEYSNSMQYGAIVYGKGALFYDALRKLVGDEVFFSSLRAYFQKYNGKLAPEDSLLEIVKEKAPAKKTEIANLFTRWIESTHGDDDITGGKVAGVDELLGGLLGGILPGGDQ